MIYSYIYTWEQVSNKLYVQKLVHNVFYVGVYTIIQQNTTFKHHAPAWHSDSTPTRALQIGPGNTLRGRRQASSRTLTPCHTRFIDFGSWWGCRRQNIFLSPLWRAQIRVGSGWRRIMVPPSERRVFRSTVVF